MLKSIPKMFNDLNLTLKKTTNIFTGGNLFPWQEDIRTIPVEIK